MKPEPCKHFQPRDNDRRTFSRSTRITLLLALAFSWIGHAEAQGYLTSTGTPPFSAPEPVEYGFTDTANGNLHLEIPLGSFPQRGSNQGLAVKLVYDSNK